MTTEIATGAANLPTCDRTGLTLPLSKHLGSQDLAKHRAMLAMELEYLAKKYDRFGWERDRNTPAQDRQKLDFMDALQDYPLHEVRAACKAAVIAKPDRMPNEGHIVAQILKARKAHVQSIPRQVENVAPISRPSAERAMQIMKEAGFAVKRVPQ